MQEYKNNQERMQAVVDGIVPQIAAEKYQVLLAELRRLGRVLIAFSGGVDS
jgi:tRNA A37 threonylcarbamoyltransferase TsaD